MVVIRRGSGLLQALGSRRRIAISEPFPPPVPHRPALVAVVLRSYEDAGVRKRPSTPTAGAARDDPGPRRINVRSRFLQRALAR